LSVPVYIIDTHPLVWYFEDSPRLSSAAKQTLIQIEHGDALGIVPTIVLAEIVHLADRQKIPVDINMTIARLRKSSSFGIVSFDLAVLLLMIPLKFYEIHDRIIVATAMSFEAPLITKDEQIQKSGIVSCIW
jgi:PIN domain nuclease of toxin-antitoxin system